MLVGGPQSADSDADTVRAIEGEARPRMDVCEDAFTHNPWDIDGGERASESAEPSGLLTLAEWYIESVQAQAKDADFFRHAARIHERNEHWHKAIAGWEQVKKLDPNDGAPVGRSIRSRPARRSNARGWTSRWTSVQGHRPSRPRTAGRQRSSGSSSSNSPRRIAGSRRSRKPGPGLALPEPGRASPQSAASSTPPEKILAQG